MKPFLRIESYIKICNLFSIVFGGATLSFVYFSVVSEESVIGLLGISLVFAMLSLSSWLGEKYFLKRLTAMRLQVAKSESERPQGTSQVAPLEKTGVRSIELSPNEHVTIVRTRVTRANYKLTIVWALKATSLWQNGRTWIEQVGTLSLKSLTVAAGVTLAGLAGVVWYYVPAGEPRTFLLKLILIGGPLTLLLFIFLLDSSKRKKDRSTEQTFKNNPSPHDEAFLQFVKSLSGLPFEVVLRSATQNGSDFVLNFEIPYQSFSQDVIDLVLKEEAREIPFQLKQLQQAVGESRFQHT